MLSRSKLFLTVFVIIAIVLGSANLYAGNHRPSASAKTISFPYLAKPISGDVNIRSGSGTAYYSCGKLKTSEPVTVVDVEFGWAKIVPPKGSFSWIAKKYVDVDPKNPKVGIVNAQDVRVWVGSPDYDALTSSTTQKKLSRRNQDVVQLLGTEDSDYLKIKPPTGAYLYVSAQKLKYVGPVGTLTQTPKTTPTTTPIKKVEPKKIVQTPTTTGSTTTTKPAVTENTTKYVPVKRTPEITKIVILCREIADKAEAEKEKPYKDQDYTELKKAVAKIATDPRAKQAKGYAEYLNNLIARYELVSIVDAEIEEHEKTRNAALSEIEKTRDDNIQKATSRDQGKYIAKGVLKPSSMFISGRKRYLVIGENRKILCYAVPGPSVSHRTVENFFNKKVALEGTVDENASGFLAVVKFSNIVLDE